MDFLRHFDTYLTLLVNGAHSPFFDQFFYNLSEKWMWVGFYISVLYVIFRKEGKQGWWVLLQLVLVVALSDQFSSAVLKPLVERLRPSHDPVLSEHIHLINGYAGGLYGFVSSHAANTAGMALFLTLLFKNIRISLLLAGWVILTAYSRVYLGVHFVGDVLCGALVGLVSALLVNFVFQKSNHRYRLRVDSVQYSSKELLPIAVIFALTSLLILLKPI